MATHASTTAVTSARGAANPRVKALTWSAGEAPGDRLTTASLAGHAMKAADAQRAAGAVLGKAMTSLDEGTGLVLVLVDLQ